MKSITSLIICSLVALITAYVTVQFSDRHDNRIAAKETAYERALRMGRLRCGYLLYSPYLVKDTETGKMSGIFYDIVENIGKNAGLKIQWVEEVGYDNIFTALNANRFDIFCGGLWPSTERAKAGMFTTPAFYSAVTAWGRNDETRFENLQGIDNASIRITVIDGALESIIAKTDYPKAQVVSSPQLSPFGTNFQNIVDGKADITFAEPSVVHEFLKTHPSALKEIAPDKPLRVFGNSLVVKQGAVDLKEFLDASMSELVFSGTIDKILKTYEEQPGLFLRTAKPYDKSNN